MNPIATLSKGGVDLNQGKEYGSLAGISDQEAEELCQALRQRVIQVVSQTGGHLASNLGAVELTVALHRFMTPARTGWFSMWGTSAMYIKC